MGRFLSGPAGRIPFRPTPLPSMRIFTTLLLAGALFGCQAETSTDPQEGADTPAQTPASAPASVPSSQPSKKTGKLDVPAPMKTGDLKLAANYEMRGEGVTEGDVFTAPLVMANAEKFDGHTVRVAGSIAKMCKGEGCWMNLGASKDAATADTIYVDYVKHESKYFPPLGSDGREVVAEGKITVKKTMDGQAEVSMKCSGLALKN